MSLGEVAAWLIFEEGENEGSYPESVQGQAEWGGSESWTHRVSLPRWAQTRLDSLPSPQTRSSLLRNHLCDCLIGNKK